MLCQSAVTQPPAKRDTPPWFPSPCPPWLDITNALSDLPPHDARQALLFVFPPMHLFTSPNTFSIKVHNWVRVRAWCIYQAQIGGNVMMTHTQWRFALEGRYYRPTSMTGIDATAKDTEISRLPLEPTTTTTLGKRTRDNEIIPAGSQSRKGPKSAVPHRKLRMMADRVDISVRFALLGGFTPYDSSSTFDWRNISISRELTENRESVDVWRGIMWELSVLNFRAEFLHMDRKMLTGIYADKDREAVRTDEVARIWSDDGHLWPTSNNPTTLDAFESLDLLAKNSVTERRPAVARMATVLLRWRGARAAIPSDASVQGYDRYESAVFTFYCKTFHSVWGRLPTMPMMLSTDVRSRLIQMWNTN